MSIMSINIFFLALISTYMGPSCGADLELGDETIGSIQVGENCAASEGQLHTFIQPSFPSSGRGWSQKLIFLALRAAGAGHMNSSHLRKFGHNIIPFAEGDDKTVEWLFSHEGDEEMDLKMQSVLHYPERPQLILRIVRNPLDNVEANFRYLKKVGHEVDNWDKFADETLIRYSKFHKYWNDQCDGNGRQPRCCITITYEDMQSVAFLKRSLKQVLRTWTSPLLSSEQMSFGVESAITAAPPRHSVRKRYASGKRYKASHYVTLATV